MAGITLSSEDVRSAPAEVRRWHEQQILTSFGQEMPAAHPSEPQLVACTVEEVSSVLSLIRDMIPAVHVLLVLGHEGTSVTGQGLEAFRLVDIQRNARLQSLQQAERCLQIINEAVCRVRGDADAAFYALDDRGYCFIAEQTQRSIAAIWEEMTATHNAGEFAQSFGQPETSYAPSGRSSPVWSAQARPVQGSASGKLAADGGIARLSR